jgi:competence protein ComEA
VGRAFLPAAGFPAGDHAGQKPPQRVNSGGLKRPPYIALCLIFPAIALAQLPDGSGRADTMELCSKCHEIDRSISLRQDREGWQTTINKMTTMGMKAEPKALAAVLDYLVAHFPGDDQPKLNVNTARAIDFEARLSLRRSEAAAIVAYRSKNGPFKSLDDLKRVPGVDAAKVESKKDVLAY